MESAALFQRTIKENSDDLHAFLEDIKSWEDEIKKKDELLSKQKPILKKTLPPIRNKSAKNKMEKVKSQKSTDKKKPEKINSYDYRGWDKFDVEQACQDSDKEVNESSSSEQDEEDDTFDKEYTQEQNQQKAMIEKEKGNLLFSQHKYEAAIERYTLAITLDPTNAVLPANRAMALLKMDRFAAAEQDCTSALSIDPTYTKVLFRRATARVKLNKLQDAVHDFNELLKFEPENKKAKAELVRISSLKTSEARKDIKERQPQEQQQEEQQNLVLPTTQPSCTRSKKSILIEEIGSGTTSEMEKGPLATAKTTSTVIKDDTLSVPKEFTGTVDTLASKSASKSMTIKSSSITAEDALTMVTTVSSTVEESSARIKDNCTTVKDGLSAAEDQKEDTPVIISSTSQPQLPPVPISSIAFIHDWKRLQAHEDLKSNYFQILPVDNYSTILSQCLETDVFPDIINILYNSYVKCGRCCIKELQALARVKRFSMALVFLSHRDKTTLCDVFTKLKSLVSEEDKPLLQQLAKTYKVSL